MHETPVYDLLNNRFWFLSFVLNLFVIRKLTCLTLSIANPEMYHIRVLPIKNLIIAYNFIVLF